MRTHKLIRNERESEEGRDTERQAGRQAVLLSSPLETAPYENRRITYP